MSWKSIADLISVEGTADVALVGAPIEAGSVTPGRCDLAPETIRGTLRRFSTYDVETGEELSLAIHDAGDARVAGLMPADGFAPIRDAVGRCTAEHALTLLLGGNNAVTRPGAHGLGLPLDRVGLVTLDAHFDLRETDQGPRNGNPVRCLLEDGLPGANICQIGLAPYANTGKMHRDALAAGITVFTIADCKARGVVTVLEEALARLGHVDAIMVDFDIDVIDRAQCPGAPGHWARSMTSMSKSTMMASTWPSRASASSSTVTTPRALQSAIVKTVMPAASASRCIFPVLA